MLSSPDLSFSRNLPLVVFNQLGELLQQITQVVETTALVITEAVLARIDIPLEWRSQRFTLVISEQFSALLLGQGEQGEGQLNTSLTFNCEAIALFASQVRDLFERESYTHQSLELYRQALKPNDTQIQTKFTLLLLEYLLPQPSEEITEPEVDSSQPVEDVLKNRLHQSELMQYLQDATRTLTAEKQTLEKRLIERTMALREALLAAEAANRLRNEFLATISHELLTPLTYVIGMSSTLLRWPLGELSKRQRDYLQTIHDSGEHLLELINDILDLSQIEAGKTVLNITEFSLTETAKNSLESLIKKAASKQINLQLDLQIDPRRDRFTADAERIGQILWNLLTNAIKFTPEGGSVTLRIWVENNTAIFQIEDTGIGIPEAQLPLLFEKFQQLDTPYRRSYEGTGLGLALTKQLVELHRGRIEVESTVAIGSIFTVWIPAQL
ncbi:MAG TPA: HAMP domain-containing sensor histidine kinase [Nodularia sp. (in: cyanobacteria)]|nr:HAMP domain-containing sensor histidine kinase [Nodularia sp. (in: cyanobacteria)]